MKLLAKPTVRNSTIAFILAGMAITTIHEVSHLIAALALGLSPVKIYPNFVIPPDTITNAQSVIMAGTGPLFSLISGLLIIWWLLRRTPRARDGFWQLVLLWAGFLSAETGFGYCLIAPLVSGGDTGQVLALTHAAWYVYALVCAAGAIGVYILLPRLFSRVLSQYSHDKASFFELGMHPFWLGTIGLVLVYLAIDAAILGYHSDLTGGFGLVFGLIGIATIGIFATLADYSAKARRANTAKFKLATWPKAGLIATVLVAASLILGLAWGVAV